MSDLERLHELARAALEVLDAQKAYFKSRDREDLIKSKQLEKELRGKAESALVIPPPKRAA